MHLLASYRNGSLRALPQMLPAGLYEAAARRGIPRQTTGTRPPAEGPSAIPRQFSGSNYPRTSSPLAGPSQGQIPSPRSSIGQDWAISAQEKAQYDQIFASVDTSNKGYVTGDEAVGFFSNSRLPEDVLAQIWDLADINSEGQLNRDEFAVAMYLIKQQRAKTDGRNVLPASLPPNLVPPSMRNRAAAPAQPTAPAFDNTANTTISKSASEDLFGLDAASSPAPASGQPTPDRATFASSPPPVSASPQSAQQPVRAGQGPQSVFKPFVPSSSFGQSILQPQTTGQSQSSSGQPQTSRSFSAPQNDDLLGDNDPEVSKKLTQETSELANLSNQVSSLTNQMQQVKSKRMSTEQDLSQAQDQKRDFEHRLSQLRTAYENEVGEVRMLEDQLSSSRTETSQLQRDFAMLSETYQDLQTQHDQLDEGMKADQAENADLREKIRQTNAQISALKSQLEKMRLDVKKQQGLVAINRKQLSTTDGEREKVQQDLLEATKEHAEAAARLQASTESGGPRSEPVTSLPAVASSPSLPRSGSSTSMNPFFRQNTSGSAAPGPGSPFDKHGVISSSMNTFDTLFGPSIATESQPSGPPPTSFQSESSIPEQSSEKYAPLPRVADLSRQATGPPSGPATPSTNEPPPPPQSRQITSSYLPLRGTLDRKDSTTSSVKVVPPASRMGSAAFDSPLEKRLPGGSPPDGELRGLGGVEDPGHMTAMHADSIAPTSQHTPPSSDEGETPQEPTSNLQPISTFPARSSSQGIPGAFPGDATPPVQVEGPQQMSGNAPLSSIEGTSASPYADLGGRSSPQNSSKDDFDSAFQGFSAAPAQERTNDTLGGTISTGGQKKFPGIQEFGDDDDSDSDTERGFDDDFTTASPRRKPPKADDQDSELPQSQGPGENGLLNMPKRPFMPDSNSNTSQLPTPGAQQSPPTYDQSVPTPKHQGDERSMSNSFPAEYTDLLPSREDPTSPPPNSVPSDPVPIAALGSKGKEPEKTSTTSGPDLNLNRSQSIVTGSTPIQHPPALPSKTPFNDFDNDFTDLSEAKEATEEDADPPGTASSRGQNGFDEFNPTFDSPTPSRSTVPPGSSTVSADSNNTFHDFESSINQGFGSTSHHAANPSLQSQNMAYQGAAPNHDWDAMFAGLDTPQNNGVTAANPLGGSTISGPSGSAHAGESVSPTSGGGLKAPSRPDTLQRSLTGEDDPILKDLTNMGYPRDEALQALEKYDYNLDVVSQLVLLFLYIPCVKPKTSLILK